LVCSLPLAWAFPTTKNVLAVHFLRRSTGAVLAFGENSAANCRWFFPRLTWLCPTMTMRQKEATVMSGFLLPMMTQGNHSLLENVQLLPMTKPIVWENGLNSYIE